MASWRVLTSSLALLSVAAVAVWVQLRQPGSKWHELERLDAPTVAGICGHVTSHLNAKGFWLDTEDKRTVVRSGGVRAIVKSMERLRGDPAVQTACVAAIMVSVAGVQEHQRTAAKQGAIGAVLGAITAHPREASVVKRASTALGALCDHANENSATFGRMGANEALVQALRDHDDDPDALFHIYCGLTGMACHDIAENNARLVQLGIIEIAIGHMRRYKEDHSVREEVQPVLAGLVRSPRNETHRQMVIDAGFIPEVVSALRDFPKDQRLVSKCLESVRDFSLGRPDVGTAWREAGAVELMAEAMANFEPLKTGAVFWNVHTSGAQAALTLAHLSRENRAAILGSRLPAQLKRSMQGDSDAERCACETFHLLAKDGPEARRALQEQAVPERCLA